MKNLFTFLLTIATVSLFAQGSNTGTGGTTINPELENLGGFKPDINNFNPNNSGVFGPFGNADATEGPSHVANYTDRQESEGAGPRTLATVTYSLYPNPATDYVVIELSEKDHRYPAITEYCRTGHSKCPDRPEPDSPGTS